MIKHQRPMEECYVCGAPARQSRVPITIRTAMETARASRSTVKRWMSEGKVEWFRTPRGSPRIYLDSLFKDPTFQSEDYATDSC